MATELTGLTGWGGEGDQLLLRNRIADEVMLFRRTSGTALFAT